MTKQGQVQVKSGLKGFTLGKCWWSMTDYKIQISTILETYQLATRGSRNLTTESFIPVL